MAKKVNEIKLLKKCLKGNPEAFEVIVGNYQELVCAITYSGTANVDQSEELAQQTFVNAWKKLSQLKDLSSFRPWLCTIARNNVRNYLRKKQRDIIDRSTTVESLREEVSSESGPVESAITAEHYKIVSSAILALDEEYREPLVLYYRQHKSIKEVAQSLDLSETAVRQRLFRGRKMIKQKLSSIVENTLSGSGPKKGFTTAVIAAVTGLAIKNSSAATTVSGQSSSSGTSMSGAAIKIVAGVAAVVIGAAAIVIYMQFSKKPEQSPSINSTSDEVEAPFDSESAKVAEVGEVQPVDNSQNTERIVSNTEEPQEQVASRSLEESDEAVVIEESVFVFESKGVLSGLITDVDTGEAVTDGRVRLSNVAIVETDENGFYYFEKIKGDGNYSLDIASDEYVGRPFQTNPVNLNLTSSQQRVEHFQLPKACMIDIRVIDEAGEPVKGATVYATSPADRMKYRVNGRYTSKTTDENGYALLGGFSPSETNYLITAAVKEEKTFFYKKRKMITHENTRPPGKLSVKLTDPEVIEYGEIVLAKGIKVRGYAEYADGVPAGGAEISAKPMWWHSHEYYDTYPVEPNGFFTLRNIERGDFNISAHIPEADDSYLSGIRVMQSSLPVEGDGLLIVRIPNKSPGSLASISGRISVVGGEQPYIIYVSAYSKTSRSHNTSVPEDTDSFSIDLLEPGKYTLDFQAPGLEQKIIRDVTAPSEDLHVELAHEINPKIFGRVVHGDSQEPVSKFRVRLRKLRGLGEFNYVPRKQWFILEKPEGKFEIETVGPGIYHVQAAAEGFAPTWSEEINTEEDTEVVISLSEGGKIKGKVVDENGEPVTDARIQILSISSGNTFESMNDFDLSEEFIESRKSQFLLENITPGTETLKVIHPDFTDQIINDIEVFEGETTEGVEIVLRKGCSVEGYVFDHNGNPLDNVTLNFQNSYSFEEEERAATVVTDPNGFYRVSNLKEKKYYVNRNMSQPNAGVVRRAVWLVKGKTARLDFGGGAKIRGVLVIDDEVISNRPLRLSSPSSAHFGDFRSLAMSNDNGEFEFCGGKSGQFALFYKYGDRSNWAKALNIDFSESNIDLGVVPGDMPDLIGKIESDAENNFEISRIALREGTGPKNVHNLGIVKEPSNDNDPYVIKNVLPGKHSLHVISEKGIYFRREIEVAENDSVTEVLFKIPKSTASVYGKINFDWRTIMLWNSDISVRDLFRPGIDGSYKFENLPAGKYYIGEPSFTPKNPIAEFELTDGQFKELDLYLGEDR